MSRLVRPSAALDLCARAMGHGCNSEAERDDVRAIYSVAGQMLAADLVARPSIQTDPRIAIPDWLTDLADQQQHSTEEGGRPPKTLTPEQRARDEEIGIGAGQCPHCEGGMDAAGGVHLKDCPLLAPPAPSSTVEAVREWCEGVLG